MAVPQSQQPEIKGQRLHWWSSPRTLLRYVLSLDDTPHHIALGAAVGMFIGLTPTVGIQMAIVIAAYYLCLPFFRFNATAALVAVYISNPLTMLPLYWLDYRVGQSFFGGELTKQELAEILTYEGFAEWWQAILTLFVDLGWTMLAGSFIVGGVGAVVTYPLLRYLLHQFRSGRPGLPLAESSGGLAASAGPSTIATAERRIA